MYYPLGSNKCELWVLTYQFSILFGLSLHKSILNDITGMHLDYETIGRIILLRSKLAVYVQRV